LKKGWKKNKLPSPEEIRRLYEQDGLTCIKIARRYGVSESAVAYYLKDQNIPHHPFYKVPPDDILRKMLSDLTKSNSDLAKELGISPTTLSRHIHRFGLHRERRFRNDTELRRLYLEEKMSAQEVANILGASNRTLGRHLREMGIARTYDEATKNRMQRRQKQITRRGYIMVFAPNHPRAHESGYVREHTLVAEETLHRPIKDGEVIHHIDFVRGNNAPSNLYVYSSHAEHRKGHNSLESVAIQLLHKGMIGFKQGSYFLKVKAPPKIEDMRRDNPTVFTLETWVKNPREEGGQLYKESEQSKGKVIG
jgi:DNA-binding CsgD family transcriptional regulator